jgi:hypothetical protein
MIKDDLDALRATIDLTTPGPWGWRHFGDDPEYPCRVVYYPGDPNAQWLVIADDIEHDADAAFIALARDAVPALLDQVNRLRAELAEYRERAT